MPRCDSSARLLHPFPVVVRPVTPDSACTAGVYRGTSGREGRAVELLPAYSSNEGGEFDGLSAAGRAWPANPEVVACSALGVLCCIPSDLEKRSGSPSNEKQVNLL